MVHSLERTPDDAKQKAKYRFPQELRLSKELSENKKGFIVFTMAQEKKSSKLFAFLITLAISAILLIRLWPRFLQLGVLYTSVTLLYLILGLLLLRILVYFPLRFFGIEFWIFPNFFGDCGIIESFLPVVSCMRSHDPWYIVIIRFSLLLILIGSIGLYWIDFNSTLKGNHTTFTLNWLQFHSQDSLLFECFVFHPKYEDPCKRIWMAWTKQL